MQMQIVSMLIRDFKGITEREIDFHNPLTAISGENGSGKTTAKVAYLWLFCNKDENGKDNPDVRPIGADDAVTPYVEIKVYTDHEIKLVKFQKLKRTGERVALTNFYEVNDVPMAERDFQKKVAEIIGGDYKLLLPLTDPDIFMSDQSKKGRDAIRAVIFSMCGEVTDLECAEKLNEVTPVEELVSLLKFYTKDEIIATQMATKRRIAEAYGKKGEIIDAKINGVLASKVEIDLPALKAEEQVIREQIDALKASAPVVSEERNKAMALVSDLQKKLADVEKTARKRHSEKASSLGVAVRTAMMAVAKAKSRLDEVTRECASRKAEIEEMEALLESLKGAYDLRASQEYDGGTTCPTCKQMLPKAMLTEMMDSWELQKEDDLDKIEARGAAVREKLDVLLRELQSVVSDLEKAKKDVANAEASLADARKAQDEFPAWLDIDKDEEYKKVSFELSKAQMELDAIRVPDTRERDAEIARMTARLAEVSRLLGQSDSNRRADEVVLELNADKAEYAQRLADADRIIYQISCLERFKNEYCEAEVNRHFRVVEWKLFRVLKNGTYEPACIPTVDGKELGSSMNTALEMTAKLDIIRTLQDFYGVHIPVWIDNAEHFDSGSIAEIKRWGMEMVILKVSDDGFEVHRN